MLTLKTFLWTTVWNVLLVNVRTVMKVMALTLIEPPTLNSSGISTLLKSAQMSYIGGRRSSPKVYAISDTHCAIRPNIAATFGFLYEGGVFTLHGPGERTRVQTAIYRSLAFPTADDLEDVARNKETFSTIHMSGLPNELVVDGDISKYYATDLGEVHPWWMIDMGENRARYQVQIFPRQDWMPERFRDIEVRIGSHLREDGCLSAYEVLISYAGPYDTNEGCLIYSNTEGIEGRYISIPKLVTNDHFDTLDISKISVFALNSKYNSCGYQPRISVFSDHYIKVLKFSVTGFKINKTLN